jgi:hypothetical protein
MASKKVMNILLTDLGDINAGFELLCRYLAITKDSEKRVISKTFKTTDSSFLFLFCKRNNLNVDFNFLEDKARVYFEPVSDNIDTDEEVEAKEDKQAIEEAESMLGEIEDDFPPEEDKELDDLDIDDFDI